jgi:PAS domain-containing protein/anti-anti-sigma regulatory factor
MPSSKDTKKGVRGDLSLLYHHLYGFRSGDYKAWFEYRKRFLHEAVSRHRWLKPLERFLPMFERAARKRQAKWDAAVRSSTAYVSDTRELNKTHASEVIALNKKLAAEQRRAEDAEMAKSGLEARVEHLGNDPRLMLGEHIMEESICGVIEFGRDNRIVSANMKAVRYLGIELEEMIGKTPSEVACHEEFAGRYLAMFEANAEALVRAGKVFEPNTFEIGGVPFDIMAYASNTGTRKFPVYGGGFAVLSPFKRQSAVRAALGKLWSTSTMHVKGAVNLDNVVPEYAKPLMSMRGDRPIYIDFRKLRSISHNALSILAKCYGALKTKDVTCVFKNAPYDVAQMLLDRGVAPEHLRGSRMVEKVYLVPERA